MNQLYDDFYLAKYFKGDDSMTFDEAEEYCLDRGSHLATIQDSDDRDEAKALCETYDNVNSRGCWIGLYHQDTESSWKWEDGSDLDYGFDSSGNPTTGVDPWWPGEPNSDGEDCIHIFENQQFNWNDAVCGDRNYPICNPTSSYAMSHTYYIFFMTTNIYNRVSHI